MTLENTKKVNIRGIDFIQFSVRFPKELNEFLQNEANRLGIPKNSLILNKLWEYKNKTN